ncbi:RimK/LysX family protein [Endozoicomonas sp. SCSIO W0465]|uniref:putative ATP-dependent zinc protease n=1 Tax=Endozoicomonas sp. SCSIO W0465 TaxID=2918516 RepID=UPI0020765D83|nr:RimK/LysX family protein [Endozoicomonas sp. SCSIO W0465]USE37616.1 RimK/LysX family protein [Endozoicomonas sp. SCSIO W0465]
MLPTINGNLALIGRDGQGRKVTLLKPVKRYIHVLTHNGKPQKRPVIETTIKFGSIKTTTEFSLTSRSNFPQSILLGRNTLNDLAVIDTSRKFILKGCPKEKKLFLSTEFIAHVNGKESILSRQ